MLQQNNRNYKIIRMVNIENGSQVMHGSIIGFATNNTGSCTITDSDGNIILTIASITQPTFFDFVMPSNEYTLVAPSGTTLTVFFGTYG